MLSVADRQQGFFDAAWCSALWPEDSIYALLAEHGERIVCDEDFAECYSERHGRPSIPPSLLAKVLLLVAESGGPGESHPRAPSDPGVTVSRHRALLISTDTSGPVASGRTGRAVL